MMLKDIEGQSDESVEGMEVLLAETIRLGLATQVVTKHEIEQVTVDTTVQEKAVTFPTDSKLRHKAREALVLLAQEYGLPLRQSYVRKGKGALFMANRYSKGHGVTGTTAIASRQKRRNAIEPIIGHCKNDREIGPRNYLAGILGDQINTISMAIGFNLRKILRAILWHLILLEKK